MFFPLRDDNPIRTVPWVNYGLIFTNVVAFWLVWSQGEAREAVLLDGLGLVPLRFVQDPVGQLPTVLSSMFLHGGWIHLATNLWSLRIFGDNLEERFGRVRYLVFYLLSGLAGAGGQILVDTASPVPMVGASGAIAGVIGAYIALYPRAPIVSLNLAPPLWLFLGLITVVPAWLIALLFFGQNLMLAVEAGAGFGNAGIAFAAHLGGFGAGLVLVWPFAARGERRDSWSLPRSEQRRLPSDSIPPRARRDVRRW